MFMRFSRMFAKKREELPGGFESPPLRQRLQGFLKVLEFYRQISDKGACV
jgi:hypothetical protein